MATKRPKDETAATTPASDDVILIDGASNGTRALPMTYFDSTYALIGTVKPLVAGTGITLTTNVDGSITIAAT